MISGYTIVVSKEEICAITLVCRLDSTFAWQDMIIASCLRFVGFFSPFLLFFVEHWLWTQELKGSVLGSELNGLSRNRVVGAVV